MLAKIAPIPFADALGMSLKELEQWLSSAISLERELSQMGFGSHRA